MCFSDVCDCFASQNSKLVSIFESLSLKPMHGNEVVYLTVFTPKNINIYASSNREKVGPIAHMKLSIVGFFA